MPELPEVENTVIGLREKVLNKKIRDFWTDTPNIIKSPIDFFKKEIKGKRIEDIKRKGKNIIFLLSSGKYILLHLKMTGHPLIGEWKLKDSKWVSEEEAMNDPMNQFIRVIFFLEDTMMALSDLRKFAKIELFKEEPSLNLGTDAMEISFNDFLKAITSKKGKIKQVLMNQEVISGIGNIYSDEILWESKINPFLNTKDLTKEEIKRVFKSMKEILKLSIKLKGDSMSDYRLVNGKKGNFQNKHKVYRREKKECFTCKGIIKRAKIGGRSAHYCPFCQKEK